MTPGASRRGTKSAPHYRANVSFAHSVQSRTNLSSVLGTGDNFGNPMRLHRGYAGDSLSALC